MKRGREVANGLSWKDVSAAEPKIGIVTLVNVRPGEPLYLLKATCRVATLPPHVLATCDIT